MRQLRQTQTSQQRQQAGVRDGSGVVSGFGFAAKGKSHGLGLRAACEVVNRVPGSQQRQRQQRHIGQACGQGRVQKRHQPDCRSPQPIRQQPVQARGLPHQAGLQPAAAGLRELLHHAKSGDVSALPRATTDKTGQHISHAKQHKRKARQPANRRLGNDGGGGQVQSKSGRSEGSGSKPE